MKFSKSKIISMFLIGSSLVGISTFASAGDLKISNDSKYDLSFSINNTCSEDFGIIDSQSIKVIPEANFNKACSYNSSRCETTVYNSAYCSGKQIGTVVFDTKYGVQGLYPNEFTFKGNGFNLFFEGPWFVK